MAAFKPFFDRFLSVTKQKISLNKRMKLKIWQENKNSFRIMNVVVINLILLRTNYFIYSISRSRIRD